MATRRAALYAAGLLRRTTPQGELVFGLMASLAQVESSLIAPPVYMPVRQTSDWRGPRPEP